MTKNSLAKRVHAASITSSLLAEEVSRAIESACGATSDDVEPRTDYHDNSLEVWGVGDIDLDAAARVLKEHGFDRVWLHQHESTSNCSCPVR